MDLNFKNPPATYAREIQRASQAHGVPVEVIQAVIAQESRFNPTAYRAEPGINDASRGLMQILERTARLELGYTGDVNNLYSPAINIDLGTKYLAKLIAGARPTRGSSVLEVAFSSYNAGPSASRPGDAKRDAAGNIVNLDSYVRPVVAYLGHFAQLAHAAGAPPASAPPASSSAEPPAGGGKVVPGWLYGLALLLVVVYVVPLLRVR